MRFILKGKVYNRTPEDVETKMQGKDPEPIRRHFVVVNGTKFPPKQVLAELLGLQKIEFTTMDAANILRRLGFKLETIK